MSRDRTGLLGALLCGTLCTAQASAGVVSLNVRTATGAPATDTIVVFDPLDVPAPKESPAQTVVIDQVQKRFAPHVTVVRTGTRVSFPNSDSIHHQVYSFSGAHPFQIDLNAGTPRAQVEFAKPGLLVLGCNIHDRMVAFVAVVDSPYFSTISSTGVTELTLPPGRYRLRVWNPKMGTAFEPRQMTVGSEPSALPLTVQLNGSDETDTAWRE